MQNHQSCLPSLTGSKSEQLQLKQTSVQQFLTPRELRLLLEGGGLLLCARADDNKRNARSIKVGLHGTALSEVLLKEKNSTSEQEEEKSDPAIHVQHHPLSQQALSKLPNLPEVSGSGNTSEPFTALYG